MTNDHAVLVRKDAVRLVDAAEVRAEDQEKVPDAEAGERAQDRLQVVRRLQIGEDGEVGQVHHGHLPRLHPAEERIRRRAPGRQTQEKIEEIEARARRRDKTRPRAA